MKVTKKNLSLAISKDLKISSKDSKAFLEKFLIILKNNIEISKVKIHKFGTFEYKKTPKRLGRNPKTGEIYTIKEFNRLSFRANNRLKKNIN